MAGGDYFDYLYRKARDNGLDRDSAYRSAMNGVRNHNLPNQPRTFAHESSRHHRDSDDDWERYARNGRPTGYDSHLPRADGGGSHAHVPYNTTEYAPHSDNRHPTEGKDGSRRHERHHQSSHRDTDERWEQFARNGRPSHKNSEHPGLDSWSNAWTKDGRTYHNIGSYAKFYNPEKGRMDEYYSDSTSSYYSGSDADDYPYFDRPSPQFGGMKDSFGNFFPQGARSKGHHQAEKDPFDFDFWGHSSGGMKDDFGSSFPHGARSKGHNRAEKDPFNFDDFWEDLGGHQHFKDHRHHSKDHHSRGQNHEHSDYHEFPAAPHAKDYYAVLGVSTTASAGQIRKAYQKLALQYHPDRVPEYKKKEATDKMAEINEAYEVLSDEIKKARYDAARRS